MTVGEMVEELRLIRAAYGQHQTVQIQSALGHGTYVEPVRLAPELCSECRHLLRREEELSRLLREVASAESR